MSDPNFPPPPPGSTPPPPPPPPGGGGFGAPPPPPGGTPPPPGGFGPPGGAPPPPGGFGGPPGGYGGPPGGFNPPPAQPYGGGQERPQLDVGSALSYGWKKFSENAGAFVALMVAVLVVSIIISIIQNSFASESSGGLILTIVFAAISYVITSIVQAGVWRAGLGVTKGVKPSFGQLVETENIVPYILTNILVGIGLVIGFVLCIVPGIAWLIFTSFASLIALEKGCSPIEAISESISWVKDNFGQVFVILLVSYIVYVIGVCLCGVGMLVSVPVALVAITYTYRALNNEMVTP